MGRRVQVGVGKWGRGGLGFPGGRGGGWGGEFRVETSRERVCRAGRKSREGWRSIIHIQISYLSVSIYVCVGRVQIFACGEQEYGRLEKCCS